MRLILTGTLLCVLASTALAGEHYIEIWNPPEARTPGAHPATPGKKAHAHHGTKSKLASAGHVGTRKVADPAMRASSATVPMAPNGAAGHGATPGGTKPSPDRTPVLEPQIGPDGNVLQVNYAVPAYRSQSPLMPVPTDSGAVPSSLRTH